MKHIFEEVAEVLLERAENYGDPVIFTKRVAESWNRFLQEKLNTHETVISPIDFVLLMIKLKVARLENDPSHADSHKDIIGYVTILSELYQYANKPVDKQNPINYSAIYRPQLPEDES